MTWDIRLRPQRWRHHRLPGGRGHGRGRLVFVPDCVSTLARADPGEVLVSRTVRDLVAGSGLEFSERGEHEL